MNGNGKVAIVTGAGTGIGKASALALLAAGYSVAFAARRAEPLETAVASSGAAERAIAVPTDVGKQESVRNLFAKTRERFGRLDVLFNHAIAGSHINTGKPPTQMTERMTKGTIQPHGAMMVEPRMDVQHVADAIVFMANLPLDANVQFMTIMATKMPFVGRG